MRGLYFRKRIGLGPLALNFSKSGIGISVGVASAADPRPSSRRSRTRLRCRCVPFLVCFLSRPSARTRQVNAVSVKAH
jgi:hypothetical protein